MPRPEGAEKSEKSLVARVWSQLVLVAPRVVVLAEAGGAHQRLGYRENLVTSAAAEGDVVVVEKRGLVRVDVEVEAHVSPEELLAKNIVAEIEVDELVGEAGGGGEGVFGGS